MGFNRHERLAIAKKLGKGIRKVERPNRYKNGLINWRLRNQTFREEREKEQIAELEGSKVEETVPEQIPQGSEPKPYQLAIALPGSILNNCQTPQLRTRLAGEIARTCAVFTVDEVVIFDETARMNDAQIESFYSKKWTGRDPVNSKNVECNLHMARVLQYMECPQYLRKAEYGEHFALRDVGLLPPLDTRHHLREDDLSIPYREGIVLDKPTKNDGGSFVDVGLKKDCYVQVNLPPGTRVTVKLLPSKSEKRLYGELTSANKIRQEAGMYWGYNVRLAKCISDAVQGYDIVVGTSERGQPIYDFQMPDVTDKKILIVFGGLPGLESAIEADESITMTDPAEFFEHYINSFPRQGSRIIRTEEAIPITLTALLLNQLFY